MHYLEGPRGEMIKFAICEYGSTYMVIVLLMKLWLA